jgi:hypothetical protein
METSFAVEPQVDPAIPEKKKAKPPSKPATEAVQAPKMTKVEMALPEKAGTFSLAVEASLLKLHEEFVKIAQFDADDCMKEAEDAALIVIMDALPSAQRVFADKLTKIREEHPTWKKYQERETAKKSAAK